MANIGSGSGYNQAALIDLYARLAEQKKCLDGGMNMNLRKVVILIAVLNLAYFGVEFAVAVAIGSVSLFADSVNFLVQRRLEWINERESGAPTPQPACGWAWLAGARILSGICGTLLAVFDQEEPCSTPRRCPPCSPFQGSVPAASSRESLATPTPGSWSWPGEKNGGVLRLRDPIPNVLRPCDAAGAGYRCGRLAPLPGL